MEKKMVAKIVHMMMMKKVVVVKIVHMMMEKMMVVNMVTVLENMMVKIVVQRRWW